MAWPYDNNPPDLVGALNLPPQPELSPQELGALARRDVYGGLVGQRPATRMGRFGAGIDKVVTHPLFRALLAGAASGIAGDPTAGQRLNPPSSLQDELIQMRMRTMQNREEERADVKAKALEREQRIKAVTTMEDGPEKQTELASLFPEDFAKGAFAKPPAFKPFTVATGANSRQDYYPLPDGNGPDMTREYGVEYDVRNPPRPVVAFRTNADGTVEYSEGGAKPVTTATQSAIEKDYRIGEQRLQRLNELESQYAPELLKWEPRIKELFARGKESLGQDLSPEDTALIDRLSEFKSSGFDLVAEYLHDLSGAAITPQEAARLLKVFPDPGTGVFDADSATQFLSKLRRVKRQTHLALLRTDYERRHGLGLGESGLFITDEKRFAEVLGKEKVAELTSQGLAESDAQQRAVQYLAGLGL